MASSYWISSVNQEKKRKDIIYDKIRNSALNVTEINEELMVYLEWLGADPGIYVEGGGDPTWIRTCWHIIFSVPVGSEKISKVYGIDHNEKLYMRYRLIFFSPIFFLGGGMYD